MKLTSGTCAWIERGGHNAAKLVITSDESPLSGVQQLTKHSRLAPKILRCGAVLAVQAEFWPEKSNGTDTGPRDLSLDAWGDFPLTWL